MTAAAAPPARGIQVVSFLHRQLIPLCAFALCWWHAFFSGGAPSAPAPPPQPAKAPALSQGPPLPYCTSLPDLFSGAWEVQRAAAGALRLGRWLPSPPHGGCAGAPDAALVSLAPLRGGKQVALVGDSISRFLFIDLAMALFDCGGALAWDGARCLPGDIAPPLPPPCAALQEFACRGKRHESLSLAAGGAALHFVWAPFAETLHRELRALLASPHIDAAAVSLGFWDVAVKTEGAGVGAHHHCAWCATFLREEMQRAAAEGNPLAQRLVFWQPPRAEPRGGNLARLPADAMALVDGCSRAAFGRAFVNTSGILGHAPGVLEELAAWEAADPRSGGALLTADGFHPTQRVRCALLNALLLHFYGAWGVGAAAARG